MDALPVFLTEEEVDVPAAPREPIRPEYPGPARLRGAEGDVLLIVAVRADGGLAGVRVLESDGEDFADSAQDAVRAVHWAPGRQGADAVSSTLRVRVRFRLE